MTLLKLTNVTLNPIKTYITLGTTPGCIQNISKLFLTHPDIYLNRVNNLMGHFQMPPGSTFIKAPPNTGLNGNISFNSPPENCKSSTLPYGMNLAEFIINNGFQSGSPQETIDISCVTGANALMEFNLSANDWTTNSGKIPVKNFQNNVWNKNTGLIGVYPYGCDTCTGSVNPPACVGLQPQNANQEPICNVQRDAKNNNGGIVELIFRKLYN